MADAPQFHPDACLPLATGTGGGALALRGLWGNLHTCAGQGAA